MSSRENVKVGIVVGDQRQLRTVRSVIEAFGSDRCVVLALDSGMSAESVPPGVEVRLFENLADMPGYMRNLEAELHDVDLLCAVDTLNLSAFQTVRIARKTDRLVAILADHPPIMESSEYPNVRAMQADILGSADHFFALSDAAQNGLEGLGIARAKISRIDPVFDKDRFSLRQERREKFRRYIADSIALDCRLAVVDIGDQQFDSASTVINALLRLRERAPEQAKSLHVLVLGSGEACDKMKYAVWEHRLSSTVSFMPQDTTPFIVDLFNGTDIFIVPWQAIGRPFQTDPYRALEAMACGAQVVVPRNVFRHQASLGQLIELSDPDANTLSAALEAALQRVFTFPQLRADASKTAGEHYGQLTLSDEASGALDGLAQRTVLLRRGHSGIKLRFQALENLFKANRWTDVMVAAEDLLLRKDLSDEATADVHRYKGDALFHLSQFDAAVAAYQECLSRNPSNHLAYRGLGYIALNSHGNEEALSFFRKSLGIADQDPMTLMGIGIVYRRIGLPEEAVFWLEKSVVLDQGSNRSAMVLLAQVCIESLSDSSAIGAVERVMEVVGEKPALVLVLGQLYLREGRIREGNDLLRRALDADVPIDEKRAQGE